MCVCACMCMCVCVLACCSAVAVIWKSQWMSIKADWSGKWVCGWQHSLGLRVPESRRAIRRGIRRGVGARRFVGHGGARRDRAKVLIDWPLSQRWKMGGCFLLLSPSWFSSLLPFLISPLWGGSVSPEVHWLPLTHAWPSITGAATPTTPRNATHALMNGLLPMFYSSRSKSKLTQVSK